MQDEKDFKDITPETPAPATPAIFEMAAEESGPRMQLEVRDINGTNARDLDFPASARITDVALWAAEHFYHYHGSFTFAKDGVNAPKNMNFDDEGCPIEDGDVVQLVQDAS